MPAVVLAEIPNAGSISREAKTPLAPIQVANCHAHCRPTNHLKRMHFTGRKPILNPVKSIY